jgi:peptidyl-prolyl cis-trans isomerase SurA
MRKEAAMFSRKTPLAAIVALAALAMWGCKRDAQPSPDVWAMVNGQPITRDQVQKYYRSRINAQAQQGQAQTAPPSQDEALSLTLSIVDELINDELMLQRAKQLGIDAKDGEVEDKFTEVKSPFSEEEFQRQLTSGGVTVDDLKQDIRRQISLDKVMTREVSSKVSITDQDISDFYSENRAQFNVAETQYRVAQIVITPRKDPQIRNRKNDDATTDIEAQKKSTALEQQLTNGADFATVAMDYSEDPATSPSGGDLGYIPESSLNQSDPVLKKAVLSMKAGDVSSVIQVRDPSGIRYLILKLMAKEMPGQRQLSDPQVQQSIRDTLRSRKEQLLRAAYIASARDQAKVTNYLAQQVIESAGKLPEIPKVTAAQTPPLAIQPQP